MDYRERWELKDYLISRTLDRRIRLLHVLIALLMGAFLLNFWYLQGVRTEEYKRLAETNRLRRVPLKPTRGVVYDRHGEAIASTRPALTLLMRREDRHDKEPQLERLADVLGVPFETLQTRYRDMRGRPLYEPLVLVEDVGLEAVARIEARREAYPSVYVEESARRFYPESSMFAHAVGYVGEVSEQQLAGSEQLASGDIVGKAGIEKRYDERVRGARGWKVVSVNNLGRQIGDARVDESPDHGDDLHLTIDAKLQRTLVEAFGTESGSGVFLDPKTGEVLALASLPSFDPNLFVDGISMADWSAITTDPERPLLDRSIHGAVAPGSIFKVVMATAGLEEGLIDSEHTAYCPGHGKYYGQRRLCWKRGGHGDVAAREAISRSCNVFFYDLGRDLGIDEIYKYGRLFGLGEPTGVDVPGERSGDLPSKAWKRKRFDQIWYPGDTISVAIGQGYLTATPLQMATMISVVANGGARVKPYLLADSATPPVRLGFAPSTLEVVRRGLEDAVQLGTATRAALEGVSVAGKTGTAQVHARSATVDSKDLPREQRSHAWFVGYAPTDKPRIAFAVIVEHGGHGGSSAAPIARAVLETFFDDPVDDPDDEAPADTIARR